MDETKPSYWHLLRSDRRYRAMLVLGFSQGIPYLLVYVTQSAWLYDAKVSITTLGFLSEMTLAYRLKFLWAPFLERYDAPVLGRLLGRRRGWMLVSQVAVILALVGIALGDPATRLWWTVVVSFALGFAGATQDVVIDGWRITSVPVERQAHMTSIAEMGYRVGILVSGAGPLLMAGRIGWHAAYLVMAAVVVPGMLAALYAPEPAPAAASEPRDDDDEIRDLIRPLEPLGRRTSRIVGWLQGLLTRLRELGPRGRPLVVLVRTLLTILVPIIELVKRLGPMALPIIVMIAGFRMPGYLTNAMAMPLFKSLHYANEDIGTVTKLFGFWIALAGVFAAGFAVPRLGIMASLLLGTVAASSSHLALAYLAAHGDHNGGAFWSFAVAVGIEGFAASFAQIVLIVYMSSIASRAFAGSQFGLLTSLVALPGSLLAAASGVLAEKLGFTWFFVGTSLIGLPVAVLTLWVWWKEGARGVSAAHRAPA